MVSQKYFVKGNKIYLWQKLCQQTIRLNKIREKRTFARSKSQHGIQWLHAHAQESLIIPVHLYNVYVFLPHFFFSTYSIYSMLLLHCFNGNLSFYINQSMTQIETLWFPCHIKKIQFVGYTSTNLWLNTQTFHQI